MISLQDQKSKYLILTLRAFICFVPVFILYAIFKNQEVVWLGTCIFLWSVHILVSDAHLRQKPLQKMGEAFLCITMFQILGIPFQYHVVGVLVYVSLFAYMSYVFLYLKKDYLYNFILYFLAQNVVIHHQAFIDMLTGIGINLVSCVFVTVVFFVLVKKKVLNDYDYQAKLTLKSLKHYLVSLNHFINSDTPDKEKKFVLARNQVNRFLVVVRTSLSNISAGKNMSNEELFQTNPAYMRFVMVERFVEIIFAFGVKVRTIQANHEYPQLNLVFSLLHKVVQRFLELLYRKEKDDLNWNELLKIIENTFQQQELPAALGESSSEHILRKITQAYEQVQYNMQLMVEELKSLQNLKKNIDE